MTSPNKVGVLVIHGMGSQGKTKQDPNAVSFSAGMYKMLRKRIGAPVFDAQIAWREVFWADILQDRQEDYIQNALVGKSRWLKLRRFAMHNLADAASYRQTNSGSSGIYQSIHQRVAQAVENIEDVVGSDAPLIIVAHSLGGHIISNYIYDLQNETPAVPVSGRFQRLETMCGFVTFGCNIPIFTFAYPKADIEPIHYPGAGIPADKRIMPWWENYNDKDDVLGMPLAEISPSYKELEVTGQLDENWINSGGALQFWNPASHNGYWKDRDLHKPMAKMLKKALKIGAL